MVGTMPKKITLKTTATKASVSAFINTIADPEQKRDAKTLVTLMKKITKKRPKLWGPSIVGFGTYTYTRSNGDYGEFMATGFSPRKSALSLYIMPGYSNHGTLLKKLGKHKKGRACLYIKRLSDVDMNVLEQIITAGYTEMQQRYDVT